MEKNVFHNGTWTKIKIPQRNSKNEKLRNKNGPKLHRFQDIDTLKKNMQARLFSSSFRILLCAVSCSRNESAATFCICLGLGDDFPYAKYRTESLFHHYATVAILAWTSTKSRQKFLRRKPWSPAERTVPDRNGLDRTGLDSTRPDWTRPNIDTIREYFQTSVLYIHSIHTYLQFLFHRTILINYCNFVQLTLWIHICISVTSQLGTLKKKISIQLIIYHYIISSRITRFKKFPKIRGGVMKKSD